MRTESARTSLPLVAVATLLFAASAPGCGGGGYGGGGGSGSPPAGQSFQGVVSAGGSGGTVTLTVQTGAQPYPAVAGVMPVTAAVTGTLRLSGSSPVALSGTYDTEARLLRVQDPESSFVLEGSVSPDGTSIRGTLSSPGGAGRFAAFVSTGGSAVLHCGTFADTGAEGAWNLARRGTQLLGVLSSPGGLSGILDGSVTSPGPPDTISLAMETNQGVGTASGTMTAASSSGTWELGGIGGSWSATAADCP